MPRPQRAAAQAARKKMPDAVKQMEEAYSKEKKESKKKKQKRPATSKGRGHANKKRGKRGSSNGAFSGPGRRLDSETAAVAVAKKGGGICIAEDSLNSLDSVMNACVEDFCMRFKDDKKLSAKMKAGVEAMEERNRNNEKLASLKCRDFNIDVVKGGTKVEGGGRLLGRKEDYMDTPPMDTSIGTRDLNWKTCMATYKNFVGGGEAMETFKMLPADHVIGIISVMFDKGMNHHLSEEGFPSMKDLFWSMGYHFVLNAEVFEAESLVDIFKVICEDKDWDRISKMGKRQAKTKNPHYKGN